MRMNRRRLAAVVVVPSVIIAAAESPVGAQYDGPSRPKVERRLSPAGETEVNYLNNGVMTHETRIPSDSVLNTSGRGSGGGGVAQPCFNFSWFVTEPNPNAVVDPVTLTIVDVTTGLPTTPDRSVEVRQPSTAWIYREVVPTGTWTPEQQGLMDAADMTLSEGRVDMSSANRFGALYFAGNHPLATATRRFEVRCGQPPGYPGNFEPGVLNYVDVPMTDPFWNPLVRLGILWGMVQLPPFRVISPPEVATYGGLVVNMPTWLQVEAEAWQPHFTAVDQYMGWYSQLGLFPAELEFEVVGPGGKTVSCAPAESAAREGAIPGFPDDLPRYYELGQLDRDCTWVPQEKGSVTIRARITYDVLLTISGFSEWLSPYVWYSDPLTLSVGELRFRNVTPEGGIGG
jgi:hypothetical protein